MGNGLAADPQALFALIVCLVLTGIFSMSESALTALGYLKAQQLHESKKAGYRSLSTWLKHPSRILTALLLYKTAAIVVAVFLGSLIVQGMYGSTPGSVLAAAMTFLMAMVFEIWSKSLGKSYYEKISLLSLPLVNVAYAAVWPFVWLLSDGLGYISFLSKGSSLRTPTVTEDELEFLVEVSEKSGMLGKLKKKMIFGVFDFDDVKVREIMTPRTDMVAVNINEDYLDVLTAAFESGYTRIPVYLETIDNIVGVLLTKDLLMFSLKSKNEVDFQIKELMRKCVFVPESNFINDVFRDLKKAKSHIAIVIDEHGGTAGLVTMEDIIETIVGEIQDEYDDEESKFRKLTDKTYLVSGGVTVYEFLEFFELDENSLESKPESDIDTVAGWLTHLIQDMPKVGQVVNINHLKIEIIRIDRHRITSVKVNVLAPKPAAEPASSSEASPPL